MLFLGEGRWRGYDRRAVAVDTTTLAVSAITLVAGAVVSGVGTYLVARRTLAYEYDSDLRKRRIEAYTDLWSRLEPLAKYAKTERFSKADAEDFAKCLRVWYFEIGGLFLSKATRTDYFDLQDLLVRLDEGWGWDDDDPETLTDAAREYLRVCGSRLRTGLTQDVGTRTRPKVRANVEHIDDTFGGTDRRGVGYELELGVIPGFLAPAGPHHACRGGARRDPAYLPGPLGPGALDHPHQARRRRGHPARARAAPRTREARRGPRTGGRPDARGDLGETVPRLRR
jgi:hypothetical protein